MLVDLLTEGMEVSGFKVPTWVFRVLISVPGLAGGYCNVALLIYRAR